MEGFVIKKLTILFILMLLTISFSALGTSPEESNILFVDGDNTEGAWDGSYDHPFQHIQDAINNSSDGDIIYVEDGVYYENIVIDKSTRLKSWGEDPYDTIIHGMNTSRVVTIDASHVMISGFTIENATSEGSNDFCIRINYDNSYITIKNNIIKDFTRAGIFCYYHSSYLSIEENEIIIEENYGIEIRDSLDSRIEDNIFYGDFDNDSEYSSGIGIELFDSYSIVIENNDFNGLSAAVDVYNSLNCEISSNKITETYSGIRIIRSTLNRVSNNTINLRENGFGNGFGVFIMDSSNNNISYNVITGADKGIMMEDAYENIVYRNNLEANKKDASFMNHQFKPNIWKENYWGRDRLFPKIIVGHIGDYYDNFRWFNIDWQPASKPHDIDI